MEQEIGLACPSCGHVGLRVWKPQKRRHHVIDCPACPWHIDGPLQRMIHQLRSGFYG